MSNDNHSEKPYAGKRDPRLDTVKHSHCPACGEAPCACHAVVPAAIQRMEHCPACNDSKDMCHECAAWLSPDEWRRRSRAAWEPDCSLCDDTGAYSAGDPTNPRAMNTCHCEAGVVLANEALEEIVPGPRITPADIDMEMATAKAVQFYRFPYTTVVVCCVTLSNGFCVTGTAAAVSAENFDYAVGCRVAKEDVENKLWELLGFRLKQALYEGAVPDRP